MLCNSRCFVCLYPFSADRACSLLYRLPQHHLPPSSPADRAFPPRRETPKSDPWCALDCCGSYKPLYAPLIVDCFSFCLSPISSSVFPWLSPLSFFGGPSVTLGFLSVFPVSLFFPTIFPSTSLFPFSLSRSKLYCRYYVPVLISVEVVKQSNPTPHSTTEHIYHLMYLPYVASQPNEQLSFVYRISSLDPKLIKDRRPRDAPEVF